MDSLNTRERGQEPHAAGLLGVSDQDQIHRYSGSPMLDALN
ncbi:hypothetical protein [Hoyosella altamirensis]|uniref:Uncharacterized protein n=1 Tax=Hoyosella altamirensis TaxID=616997 RepID=A0A839RWF3_9ACTN|nr:hypothetical protein [Hoyosella altamirensis]MBB3040071.1 hypothetical protein [Hoyosella altamirensis]